MSNKDFIFTSESVSEGHPDKICDQISDAIVDYYMGNSKNPELARVACEVMVTTNKVFIAGEVRGDGDLTVVNKEKIESITRGVIKEIGYEQATFHWNNVDITINLHSQSSDIGRGVDAKGNKDEGAGDQGIMFGYASNETSVLMPAPIQYSHAILKTIREKRLSGELEGLGPDAKSQISLIYKNSKPVGAHSVVVSIQHGKNITQKEIYNKIKPVIENTLPEGWMCPLDNLHINPTGNFEIGGPDGDAGLTGRKIIVDTYGGICPHGGGAFSGKDSTKVDRSGAYVARYMAKNIVAAGLADKCTLQLAYAIGISDPISIYIDTHGTSIIDESKIISELPNIFDLTPRGIRNMLGLSKPIYQKTASFGHFGRIPEKDGSFSWEKIDKVNELKNIK